MRKNQKIVITMVTVLALVFVNTSFVNTARAKENLAIEETLGSQIENMDESNTVSQGKYPEERVSKNEPQKAMPGEEQSKKEQSGEEQSKREQSGEEQSKEEQSREEQFKEETSTGKNGGEIITSEKGTSKETTGEKEQEPETVDNSGDPGIFSVQIISDNLPDYVEAVIEKTNVKPFQQALDEFYNQWCEEQEEEYNSEDEEWDEDSDDGDWDDEEDSDDEDYDEDDGEDDERHVVTYDEEDSDNDDLEDEEPDGRYLYYHGSNQVLSAYKISFINTKDGSEYEIPEGESVKVKVDNEAYDNSSAGGIMNLEEDGSVEMLQFEQSYDDTTDEQEEENTADTYDDGAGNSEGQRNNYDGGAANSKNGSSNYNDDNGDLDNEYDEDDNDEYDEDELEDEDEIYKETVTFDIVHGGKYAILSAPAKTTADSAGYGREGEKNNSRISPKTGVGNGWMAGEAGAFALLMVSGYYYRKKKIAKVHKND